MPALARLRQRAELIGSTQPDHFVFLALREKQIRPKHSSEDVAHSLEITGQRNSYACWQPRGKTR